jgi:hypothetical protein
LFFQLDDVEEIGSAVLARARWLVKGTTSGVEAELAFSSVWLVSDEGALRATYLFFDDDEAREFARAQGA